MSTIPDTIWGAAAKPGTDSQTGCVWHLIEGSHEPIDVVYFWGGTSVCMNHLISHAKAHPLPAAPLSPTISVHQGTHE